MIRKEVSRDYFLSLGSLVVAERLDEIRAFGVAGKEACLTACGSETREALRK